MPIYRPRALLPVALITHTLGACTSSDPATPCGAVLDCTSDPFPHCIDSACRDDEDCPHATTCVDAEPDATPAPKLGTCQVPLGTESYRNALTEGFDVPEFPHGKRVDTDLGGAVIDWRAPQGSRAVTCATFTCPPVIRRSADGRDTIVNYERCVSARMSTSERAGSFDPRDPLRAYTPTDAALEQLAPGCDLDAGPTHTAPVSTLLAGCWSYDEGTLSAATKLFEFDFGEVQDSAGLLARDANGQCSEGDAGRSCRLVFEQGASFGTCTDAGGCAMRCLDASDCQRQCRALEPTAEDEFDDVSCDSPDPGLTLGLCAACSGA